MRVQLPVALVGASVAAFSALANVPRAVAYSFWQDEVGAARVITDPGPISMLRRVVATENHPPGFYALGWVLDRIGVPVVWDRTISVLAAMALSALVVVYASRLVPLWGAAFAGLVTALGWQFWRHGWELRPYAVFALACMLFVLALAWAAERPTSGRLALLAAAVAAGTMTHFFFLFTLGAGLIWLVLRKEDTRRLLVAIAIGLLPLVAWLPAFYKQFERRGIRNPDFSLRSTLESYGALFVRGDVNLVFALLVLCLVLAGSIRLGRASEAGRLCALAATVPVLAASLVWLAGPDIYIVKNLLGAAPFAAVAIAAALAAPPRPVALAVTSAAALLVLASYADTRGRIVPDYDLVAAALVDEGWPEGDPDSRLRAALPTPASTRLVPARRPARGGGLERRAVRAGLRGQRRRSGARADGRRPDSKGETDRGRPDRVPPAGLPTRPAAATAGCSPPEPPLVPAFA